MNERQSSEVPDHDRSAERNPDLRHLAARPDAKSSPERVQQGPSRALANGQSIRHIVLRIVVLIVTGIVIYLVLPSIVAVVSAWPRLSKARPVWMAAAFGAEITSFVFNFALQRLVLRTRRWFAVVTSALAGNALTNVLPGGDAAGASLQFRMLATAGIDTDTAAGGLTAMSLLGVGGLLALPLFTLPVVLGGARVQPGLLHATLVGLAAFGLFVVFGVVLLATDRPLARLGRIAQWLWNTLRRPRQRLTGLDLRLIDQRNQIRSALGRHWREAVVFVAGRLGFDYLCLVCVLRAVGSRANPALVLLAYATAGVIALIPITPGGLGIVEAGLSGMLVLAGVGAADALIATLGYRLASYWLPLPVGSVAYVMFRRHYGPVQLTSPGEAEAGPNA